MFKSLLNCFKKSADNVSSKGELPAPTCGKPPVFDFDVVQNFFSEPLDKTIQELRKKTDGDKSTIASLTGKIIRQALGDGILDREEEKKIAALMREFQITAQNLSHEDRLLLTKNLLIRDLLSSRVKPRFSLFELPFTFLKDEIVIWGFHPVRVAEIKTVKQWQSGSNGISLRICSGIYWHLGKTKGRRVESTEQVDLGSAIVAITNKHLYMLTSRRDSLRIRHDKIVSLVPDEEGVLVFREGARTNPLYFQPDDVWFFMNLMQNATNWDSRTKR
jgi:hypothetical protein